MRGASRVRAGVPERVGRRWGPCLRGCGTHGFAVFNALSWQIVLGPPVILFAKGLGASAKVWVGGRLCEVCDSPRVLRGCVLGLLVAVAGWAAAMVSRLPQGPPLNPPYSRHTPKAPCAEHGAAPSPLRPSAGR